jgi:hypothetical protein
MKRLYWFGFGLLVLLAGFTAVSAQPSGVKPVLTLERTACFGSCPIYAVSVYDDGTVVYQGERFVDVTGEQTTQIDPALVQQMVQAFVDAGYFDWNESYTEMFVSDMPSVITSVTKDGQTHRIERYDGDSSAPLLLPFLENWLDLMVNTAQWTGAQANPIRVPVGMDGPVATLQRDPCFGFCPVYNVAAFADGTIVYTGIANVDRIGVYQLSTDPLAIESVVMQAEATGYFGWNDAYDAMTITDQAYVTTSIRTDEQFKQILRYEGDANAPIGLTWVERSIDQLVTDATE